MQSFPHDVRHQYSRSVLRASVLVISVLFASKSIAGILGHSHALLAAAVDSVTQLGSVLLVGLSSKATSAYGAPANSSVIRKGLLWTGAFFFLAAALITTWFCLTRVGTPHQVDSITPFVLGGTIVLENLLLRRYYAPGVLDAPYTAPSGAWYHPIQSTSSHIALIGVSLAILGGPGYEWADDWAALCITGFLYMNAYRAASKVVQAAQDATPSTAWLAKLQSIASAVPGVQSASSHFIVRPGVGNEIQLLLRVDEYLSIKTGNAIAQRVNTALLAEVTAAGLGLVVFTEPDYGFLLSIA